MPVELKNVIPQVVPATPGKAVIVEVKPEQADKLQPELVFTFEYLSPEDNRTYSGTFKARRLTLGGFGQMKVLEARLNGGVEPPTDVQILHNMLAYCKVAIVEAPDWWKPDEFYEFSLLSELYSHVRQWESSFRRDGVG